MTFTIVLLALVAAFLGLRLYSVLGKRTGHEQEPVARQFTLKSGDRFAGLDCETWATGAPILPGCMANFECETHHAFDAGDHRVFVGRVLKVRFDPEHEPLVYLQGRFRRVHTD